MRNVAILVTCALLTIGPLEAEANEDPLSTLATAPAAGQPPPGSYGQPGPTTQAPADPQPPPRDPYGTPVTAGGLQAPPPMDPTEGGPPTAPPSETEQQLDASEEEDSGRGLTWFWLDAEGGYQYVGLESFTVDEESLSAGFEKSDDHGGYVGAGLGFQLLFLRIGPRFRVGFFEQWQLYSLDGEVGFRIPVGPVEPHFEVAGGYSALGSLSGFLADIPESVRIDGFNVRVGGGLDFFPSEYVSIGGVFSWEFLGLTRPGVDPATAQQLEAEAQSDAERARAELLAAEGSGYGTSITIGARIGLHF